VRAGAAGEALIAEAAAAPIDGWDFGWLAGRATEQRPTWRYSRLVAERARHVRSMLDLQTGGGEVIGELADFPPLTVVTEGWEPNVTRAARRLHPRRAWVVKADEGGPTLPFGPEAFELVTSRHPVVTCWSEVARVLAPGGRFLSQQVGPWSMRELTEFFLGPQSGVARRTPERARHDAEGAGLRIEDLKEARLRATFHDVGAVVYFLRLVVWTVPGFDVEIYRERLEEMHRLINEGGPFVAHATRFLVEATKPD
jgi:SAM-dependent methyltransferase